jgi:hypothetical protein
MDIESLEKRNDASISALEGKTALLKNITSGIHGEVLHHHSILDSMVGLFVCLFVCSCYDIIHTTMTVDHSCM